jgi:hypothetical protein
MSQQHFACSHAPLFGKPACCKESEPLRPLAAKPSAAMTACFPPLWAIRIACPGVSQSYLWHGCEGLHSPTTNTLVVKQTKGGRG